MSSANNTHLQSSGHLETDSKLVKELNHLTAVGDELVGNNERRLIWLELFRALNAALPRAAEFQPGVWRDPTDHPFDERVDIYIKTIESQYFEDLDKWFTKAMQRQYRFTQPWLFEKPEGEDGNDQTDVNVAVSEEGSDGDISTSTSGPSGHGWVIELTGYHYFNKDEREGGVAHVRKTIVRNLSDKIVMLPDADGNPRPFTMDELGIGYAVLMDLGEIENDQIINPNADPGAAEGIGEAGAGGAVPGGGGAVPGGGGAVPGGGGAAPGVGGDEPGGEGVDTDVFFKVKKYSFTLQFVWQAPLVTERLTRRNEFVTAWDDATSLSQVASTLGMTVEQVERRALRYRQMNDMGLVTIDLKDFDQPQPLDGNNGAPVAPDDGLPEGS